MSASRIARRALLLGVVAAVASVAFAPAPASASRSGVTFMTNHWAVATFTEYADGAPNDDTILNEAITLLSEATPGSAVSINLHSMTDEGRFEAALDEARDRGVWIGINFGEDSNDLDDWANPPADPTKTDRAPTFLRKCPAGTGCISSNASGEMHMKFMLFSELKRPDGSLWPNNVWVTSANMTVPTGTQKFNNAVTLFGVKGLYDQLREVWEDGYYGPYRDSTKTRTSDYFRSDLGLNKGWGYFHTDLAGAYDENTYGYVSPDSDTSSDMWKGRFDDVKPPFEGGGPCAIRVMQTQLDPKGARQAPVDELVRLKNRSGAGGAGCSVYVVVNKQVNGPYEIGQRAREKLYCAGIPVRWARVHDKSAIITGTYAGIADRRIVVTGSQNMTYSGLRENDDLMLRFYDSPGLYDLFYAHFGDAYSQGNTVPRDVEGDNSWTHLC